MYVAQEKRKENITEYLLYMFQVEDMIRACELDLRKVEDQIIPQYGDSYETRREVREWYKAIIGMLRDNGKEETGHIPLIETLIDDLDELHKNLLSDDKKREYSDFYLDARPGIEELRKKSGEGHIGDVRACLNGLYGYVILKMTSRQIHQETEEAIKKISHLLAALTVEFHSSEKGDGEGY